MAVATKFAWFGHASLLSSSGEISIDNALIFELALIPTTTFNELNEMRTTIKLALKFKVGGYKSSINANLVSSAIILDACAML